MKKISLGMLLIIFIIIAATGCAGSNHIEYKTLTKEEWKQFAQDNNIKVLDVENIKKSTNILYTTDREMGLYNLSKDPEGEMVVYKTSSNNNSKHVPVSLSFRSTGIPLVTVIINDEELRDKASRVLVYFANGDKVEEDVDGRRGMIIANDEVVNDFVEVDKVEILDKNSKVIFEN